MPGIGAGGDDFARHNIVRPAIAEIRLLLDAGFNIAKHAGAGCRQPRIAQRNLDHALFQIPIKSNARDAQIPHLKFGLDINILNVQCLDQREDKRERTGCERACRVIDWWRAFFENLHPGMAQNGPAICHRAAQLGFNARDFRISREADRNRRAIRHNPGARLLAASR